MTTKCQAAALGVSAATLGLVLAACGGGGESTSSDSPATMSKEAPSATATATGTATSTTSSGSDITRDRAGQIATDKYGGDIISVENDSHNGEPTWEVELKNSDQGRIEVEVTKSSGKIVKTEPED